MHVITYQRAVGELRPVIEPLFEALTQGIAYANDLHTSKPFRRRLDPWFYSHAVRRVACDVLRDHGLQAELDGSDSPLHPLSGILVFYRGMALKVLRPTVTSNGTALLPLPGRSARRQAFWRQEQALPEMDTENLLLVWRDEDGSLVDPVALARPLGGDHRRANLKVHWEGSLSRSMAELREEDLDGLQPYRYYPQLGDEETG